MKRFHLKQICAALPIFAIVFAMFRPIIDMPGGGTVAIVYGIFYAAASAVLFASKAFAEFVAARIVAWGQTAGAARSVTLLSMIIGCIVSFLGPCLGAWLVLLHFLPRVLP